MLRGTVHGIHCNISDLFRLLFTQIIDYVSAYKPLLTAIKAEYEECIETIQRGQQEAFYLSGKLKAVASQPSTIYNFKKRADELEHKWVWKTFFCLSSVPWYLCCEISLLKTSTGHVEHVMQMLNHLVYTINPTLQVVNHSWWQCSTAKRTTGITDCKRAEGSTGQGQGRTN